MMLFYLKPYSAGSIGDAGLSSFGKSLGSLSSLQALEVDLSGYFNSEDLLINFESDLEIQI